MICIVPLAGPDFVHPSLGIKPLYQVSGVPLIEYALSSRPWWGDNHVDYVFVLRDLPESAQVSKFLQNLVPNAAIVTVSRITDGALFSALAGMAMTKAGERPICIDLADIVFSSEINPRKIFEERESVGGILPIFPSDDPKYSYARIEDGLVTETREKVVISNHASAGVYLFRNTSIFLSAAAHSLTHAATIAHNNILFVCPAMNGVIDVGYTVVPKEVTDCEPISVVFHD